MRRPEDGTLSVPTTNVTGKTTEQKGDDDETNAVSVKLGRDLYSEGFGLGGSSAHPASCSTSSALSSLGRLQHHLAANSGAIELPQTFIDNGWFRVAFHANDVPNRCHSAKGRANELDGQFVEPTRTRRRVARRWQKTPAARVTSGCRVSRGERGASPRFP